MSLRLRLTLVEAPNTRDHGSSLLVNERRPAAHSIPAKQELQDYSRVQPMPEQVPGQGGDRVIALPGGDAIGDKSPPVRDRVTTSRRLFERLLEQPVR